MKIYIIRHGQTDFNKAHRLQGKVFDEPLNAEGIKEVMEIIPSLPNDFEVIFASPLKRVQMSAQMIRDHFNKSVITDEGLSERDFGSLAGQTWKDIAGGEELRKIDQEHAYDYRPFGGESVDDVRERFKKFLNFAKSSGYHTVLVVTSRGVLRVAYELLKGELIHDIKNASVHEFDI